MLVRLSLRDVALIEKADIEFEPGFCVLTGETGAGKSIIVDAVELITGARADKELIRTGCARAYVEALFCFSGDFSEYGIESADEYVISREIGERSTCRINGKLVSTGQLKEITAKLINLHGQHHSTALLEPKTHLPMLDGFANIDTSEVSLCFSEYQKIAAELKKLSMDEAGKARRIDMLTFQIGEIESAKLTPGEEEGLSTERHRAKNAHNIQEKLQGARNALSSPAIAELNRAAKQLASASEFDDELQALSEKILSSYYELSDVCEQVGGKYNAIDISEHRIDEIEDRLIFIRTITRKYGGSETATLEFLDRAKAELESIELADEKCELLKSKLDTVYGEYLLLASELTASRKSAAEQFSAKILGELSELGMEKAKFEVRFERSEMSADGVDDAQFFMSANPGEDPKPLAKVVSGGEASRIMLAIKCVCKKDVPTLIFDEIDTGISGRVAVAMAKKIAQISKDRQVICVTHLPQLAATATANFEVSKSTDGVATNVKVHKMTEDEVVSDIARLAGGMDTKTAYEYAAELRSHMK